MGKVRDLVQNQDKFGSNIVFSFKKNQQHNTFFGGIISLLINASSIFITYFFAQELWLKKQPNTIYTEEVVDSPERFNLTSKSYTMAFGIQDNRWNHFVNDSIYTMEVIQNTKVKTLNEQTGEYEDVWKSWSAEPHQCTDYDLENFQVEGTEEYFKNLYGIKNMYCLNMDKAGLYIEGDFSVDRMATIEFSIKTCNSTLFPKIKCAPVETINSILEYSVFAVYFTDKVIDPTNLDHPFANTHKDLFWPVSNGLAKEITLYMRNYYIESDIGLVSEEKELKQSALFQYQTEQAIYKGQTPSEFVRFVFRFEKQKQTRVYRNYQKIQDILANVSGVTDLFMVIGALICIPLSELDLNKELVNEVYSFQKTNEELQEEINEEEDKMQRLRMKSASGNINSIVKKITQTQMIKQKEALGPDLNSPKSQIMQSGANGGQFFPQSPQVEKLKKEQKQFNKSASLRKNQHDEILSNVIKSYNKNQKRDSKLDKQIEKLFKFTKDEIQLENGEYVSYFLCPCKKKVQNKRKQIEYSKDLLEDHLDVLYIINKLLEVDKLKLLLLNPDQLKLFSYLPKPVIKNEDVYRKFEKKKVKSENEIKADKDLDFLFMDKRTNLQKAVDAYEAFNNLKKQTKRDNIDNKLLQLLDPKIIEYFAEEEDFQNLPLSPANFKKVHTINDNKPMIDNNCASDQIVDTNQFNLNKNGSSPGNNDAGQKNFLKANSDQQKQTQLFSSPNIEDLPEGVKIQEIPNGFQLLDSIKK